MPAHRTIASLVAFACFAASAAAQTKYPGITSVNPVAVQRGAKTVVVVASNGEAESTYKALVSGPGVSARVLPREKSTPKNECSVEISVAADAPLGPREIRLAAKPALTTAGCLYVTSLPIVREKVQNDTRAAAQPIELPSAVCGRIEKNVDEDWYRFEGKAGERVSFNVLGARLHNTIHKIGRFVPHFDPMLTLTDARGVEIAGNDDFFFADSYLSAALPRDGTYYVCLREATYKGNDMYTYALQARKGTQPTNVLPMAMRPGETASARLMGPGVAGALAATLTMPADARLDAVSLLSPIVQGAPLAEVPVVASRLPRNESKAAPNADRPAPAQGVQIPSALVGVLDRRGQVVQARFSVKKDRWYRFEVLARRLFSPLDSELTLLDAETSRVLQKNDDMQGQGRAEDTKDSAIVWKAPKDLTCVLQLRDMLGKGGADYAYHLIMDSPDPDFALKCDPSLVMIGPGSRSAVFVRSVRKYGFSGPISLSIRGLPKGVSASAGTIPAGQTDGCIVLEAASDAQVDATNVVVEGAAEIARTSGGAERIVHVAQPQAEIYQAQRVPEQTIAVAVTEPSDIKVETTVRRVVLRPGETKEIPIRIIRAGKYKTGPVTLWADWRFERQVFGNALPPGVAVEPSRSKTALNGSETEGVVALSAAPDAPPCSGVQTTILGEVSIEFSVNVPYCTAPIEVVVAAK